MMQPMPESEITARLLQRAHLLAMSPNEGAYWRDLFVHAKALGQLLHIARQQLDTWHQEAPIDDAVVRMWEWGLVLPEEIAGGALTRLSRWYIDRLRQQRSPSHMSLIDHDFIALVTELTAHSDDAPSLAEE